MAYEKLKQLKQTEYSIDSRIEKIQAEQDKQVAADTQKFIEQRDNASYELALRLIEEPDSVWI